MKLRDTLLKNRYTINNLVVSLILLFSIIILLTVCKIGNKIEKLENTIKTSDNITITQPVETDTDLKIKEAKQISESNCNHNWKVVDVNESFDAITMTCDGCGGIRLVDYRNHKIRDEHE